MFLQTVRAREIVEGVLPPPVKQEPEARRGVINKFFRMNRLAGISRIGNRQASPTPSRSSSFGNMRASLASFEGEAESDALPQDDDDDDDDNDYSEDPQWPPPTTPTPSSFLPAPGELSPLDAERMFTTGASTPAPVRLNWFPPHPRDRRSSSPPVELQSDSLGHSRCDSQYVTEIPPGSTPYSITLHPNGWGYDAKVSVWFRCVNRDHEAGSSGLPVRPCQKLREMSSNVSVSSASMFESMDK